VVLSTYVPSPRQSTSLYVYDAAGRLTAKGAPGGAMPYQLEYDGLGRIARFKRDQFETRYHHDAIGRIVGIVHAGPPPDAGSMSEYLGYSEGCTAAITAGLIPCPVDDLMTSYYDAADPRWVAVRAAREEPPGF
jgi:YD repeat-containing protein